MSEIPTALRLEFRAGLHHYFAMAFSLGCVALLIHTTEGLPIGKVGAGDLIVLLAFLITLAAGIALRLVADGQDVRLALLKKRVRWDDVATFITHGGLFPRPYPYVGSMVFTLKDGSIVKVILHPFRQKDVARFVAFVSDRLSERAGP